MKPKYIIVFLTLLVLHYACLNLRAQLLYTQCAGQKGIRYQVTGKPGSIFHWTVQGGLIISDPQTSTIIVNWSDVPGEYTISVYEETNTGCLGNTRSIKVKVIPAPVFNMGNTITICEGDQIELNPGKEFYKYLWNDRSSQQTIMAQKSGVYWAEVTDMNGCAYRDTVELVVNPPPKVELGKDTMLCAINEVLLDAGTKGEFYQWSNGANTQTILAHENDGLIWVKVTDANGCTGYDSIRILQCPSLQDLNIPNAFTPDGDGHNDYWVIKGAEKYPLMMVLIYDRWGLQVFNSERGYSKPWDGNSKGKAMPTGVYYYIIRLGNDIKDIVGSITLIR